MKTRSARLFAGLLLVLLLGSAYSAQYPSARFPLPPNPSTIEGTLVDAETGKPLAGMTVIPPWPSSWPTPPPNLPLVFPLVQTDAGGHFVRDNIFGDNGRASISFLRTNDDFYSRIFTIAPGQRLSGVVIRLRLAKPATGLVTGRVVDESGKGASNVEVALYRASIRREYDERIATRTDDRGEFRLYGVKRDRYIVGYSAGRTMVMLGFAPAQPSSIPAVLYPGVANVSRAEIVNVENGTEVRLREMVIGPVRMGKLRVHVINRGEPAKDGMLGTGDGMSLVQIAAGADLREEYSPVGPGIVSFGVRWTTPGSPESEYSTSIDFDGTDRSIEIDLSRVHGVLSVRTLIDQADGSTVPFLPNTKVPIGLKSRADDGVKVNTRSASSDLVEIWGETRMAIGPDGTANFTDLVTGSYNLDQLELPPAFYLSSVRQDDRDALEDGIDISSQPSTLEIHLRQGAAVFRGKVSDIQGQPVQGARVFLMPESPTDAGRVGMRLGDVTDQDGHFEVPGIVPGRYRAYAALGIDLNWANDHTITGVDPDFVATFKERAIQVTIGENGRLTRDLTLLTQ